MKIQGRVKTVGIQGQRWAAMMMSGQWVSQFLNEKMSPELKVALESVREGETWEFDCAETTSKKGATFLNVVGASRVADTGQDSEVQPGGHDRSDNIARSVGAKCAAWIIAAKVGAGKEVDENEAKQIADFWTAYTKGE